MKGIADNRPAQHQIAGIGGNQPNKGRCVRKWSNLPDKMGQQVGVFIKVQFTSWKTSFWIRRLSDVLRFYVKKTEYNQITIAKRQITNKSQWLKSKIPNHDQTIEFWSYLRWFGYCNFEFICNLVLVICYFRFIRHRRGAVAFRLPYNLRHNSACRPDNICGKSHNRIFYPGLPYWRYSPGLYRGY